MSSPTAKRRAKSQAQGAEFVDPAGVPAAPKGLVHPEPNVDAMALAGMMREFPVWCQYAGLQVDGQDFDFDQRRYLIDIYSDTSEHLVVKKAAQLGLSSFMMLRALWAVLHHRMKAGFYFPTDEGMRMLSKDRMAPMIAANDAISKAIIADDDAAKLKRFKNYVGSESSMYLMHISGKASKDSIPLDYLLFDEVRLMEDEDIQQTMERITASRYGWITMASTAGPPGVTIDRWFNLGSQHTWLSRCGCSEGGVDLSEVFPDCVVETAQGEVYYRCPRCKYRINDPQNGQYVAKNPRATIRSYFVSQLAAKGKRTTPAAIWQQYKSSTDLVKFYADKLGRWYDDKNAVPITMDILESCVDPDVRWAYDERTGGRGRPHAPVMTDNAMGVDQHGGNVYALVARRDAKGDKQLVHLEIVEAGNPDYFDEMGRPQTPFARLHQMMREFNVGMCVIDALPNYNEAKQFAMAFPGRVFLSYYSDAGQDSVRWLDRSRPSEAVRKGGAGLLLKWQVYLDRYKVIDDALSEFVNYKIKIPDPRMLVQKLHDPMTGRFNAEMICRRLFTHLTSIAREKEVVNRDTGAFKMKWKNRGLDPHFVHAYSFCRIALERMSRRPIFTVL